MTDVRQWLNSIDLGQYADAFENNAIEWSTLPELDHQLLKEIGVKPVGHRVAILKAIQALDGEGQPSDDVAKVATVTEPSDEAERRQLTVMFCDLVGSTALSAEFDPEETRKVILRYQDVCAGVIARFEGFLARFMGDGVLAYFGYPQAHEDEAERAVRAGMALTRAVAELESPAGEALSARVGIATGLVVVGDLIGDGAAQETAVVGDAPNLAARLQGIAAPGQVLIAEATSRLLGFGFELEDLGEPELKGIGTPIRIFAVAGERVADSRFEARHHGHHLEIVGRDQELALLMDRWHQAQGGEGQMVLLTGEAGIGKSRITRAQIDSLASESHTRISYQCSPYQSDSALYPVVDQLRRAADFAAEDSTDQRLDKLESVIAAGTADIGSIAPLFAALLDLEAVGRYGALDMTPQQQRRRTLEALSDQLCGLSLQRPVLLVIEDVHWIDPTTLELMELILDKIQDARVFLLATARPTFQHSFSAHPIVTHLALNRLGRSQIMGIVEHLMQGATMPPQLLEEIVKRTDGIPLYVEELTKSIIESDVLHLTDDGYALEGSISGMAIPISLHDSLMARLDRLQPVKEVAQTAACVGRDFDYRTLSAIFPLPGTELQDALERLEQAELVFRRGEPPEASYTFKHALVRDAAYESLLLSTRQQVHARILAVFEETGKSSPEVAAHHATEAGSFEKAIYYWQRAGSAALERSAIQEAMGHLRTAIRLTRNLEDERQRMEKELELQVLLGQALIANRGYAALETKETFAQALRIANEIGDTHYRIRALFGQWSGEYIANGPTSELAEDFWVAASEGEESGPRVIGLRIRTLEELHAGHFERALELVEKSLGTYIPEEHRALALEYGHDPRVAALNYLCWLKWLLGYPDQSEAVIHEAMEWADEIGHANTQGIVRCWGLVLSSVLQRRIPETLVRARQTIEFADERVMSLWRAWSNVYLGWAETQAGEGADGLSRIEAGLDELEQIGAVRLLPWNLALHGEATSVLGRQETALQIMQSAFDALSTTRDHLFEAELYRIRGDISARLHTGVGDKNAQADFERAITIARRQQAISLELRATLSLARLLAGQSSEAHALELLAPVLGSFSEGFESPDLVEAKAFLDTIS